MYNTEDWQEVICYVLNCKHWECLKTRHARSDEKQTADAAFTSLYRQIPLLQAKLDTQRLHTIRIITNRPPPVKLRMGLVCASARLFHNQTCAQASI